MRDDTKTETTLAIAALSKKKAPVNPARLKAFYKSLIERFNALPDNVKACIWIGCKNIFIEDKEYYYMRSQELHGVILRQRKPTGGLIPTGYTYSTYYKVEVVQSLPSVSKSVAKVEANDLCPFEPCAGEIRQFAPMSKVGLMAGFNRIAGEFCDPYGHKEKRSPIYGTQN